jgi:hypothetical protein
MERMTKALAKQHYLEFKDNYALLEAIEDKNLCNKANMKMIKGQMEIYAGIFNNDEALFKKGVKNFDKFSIEMLELAREKLLANKECCGLFEKMYNNTEIITHGEETFRQLGKYIAKKHKYYHELDESCMFMSG